MTRSVLVEYAYPFFLQNIYVGLVPLFYEFLYTILSHYGIRALHFQPIFILPLAIFTFYCNAFLHASPTVALFCHFFSLRFAAQVQRSSCVSFINDKGEIIRLNVGKKVEGYRHYSVFMDVCQFNPLLMARSA
ncbi:hypothetical protein D1007_35994 [Hordeum vulgare]|nr:hypothetical protein D1007_35994 [Hordeum vulgare]